MHHNRRTILGAAALAASGFGLARQALAQASFPAAGPDLTGSVARPVIVPSPAEPAGILSSEVIELWPVGAVPGGQCVTVSRQVLERGSPAAHDRAVIQVTRPIMEVFRPDKPNGAAMILLPGGGYVRLAVDKEGGMGARHFAAQGVTAFVLNYRLPRDGWAAGFDAPLQDVQRAVRLARSHAARFGLDPARICVMGFSAGGHLAGASLTRFDDPVYAPVDAADQVSARPDLAALCYASMRVGPPGQPANTALDERVRPGLAPTFVLHAMDDATVPVGNSVAMIAALKAAKVPVQSALYEKAGHGFGFSLPPQHPAAVWPSVFEVWARGQGFFGA